MIGYKKALKTGKGFWLGGFAAIAIMTGCLTSENGNGNTNPAPTITAQPSNRTVTAGGTAMFSVTATGTGTLTYQWQRNNVDISGATAASYTTPATVVGDDGDQFRCVVTNANGSTTSNAATLYISVPPPSITTEPTDDLVLEGGTATFSVIAAGSGTLTYRWISSTMGVVPGATTNTLTFTNVMANEGGSDFRCVVSNSGGSDTSVRVFLMVNAPVTTMSVNAGAQDNFNSFIDIDDMIDYTIAEIATLPRIDAEIDLFFGFGATESTIYTPYVARYGVGGGGGGFNIAQTLSPANSTEIRSVSLTLTQFNAINNKSQIDAYWAAAVNDADGRLGNLAVGDTFMARSNLGLIVLIRITALVTDTDGTVNLDGTTRF